NVAKRQRLPAAGGTLEEEELFLQVRGEVEQAQDLTEPGSADVAQPGGGRVTGNGARPDQCFDVPGQGQQPRDPWDARRWQQVGPGIGSKVGVRAVGAAASSQCNGAFDDDRRAHDAFSFVGGFDLSVMATWRLLPSYSIWVTSCRKRSACSDGVSVGHA